jgi:hypothetical protein
MFSNSTIKYVRSNSIIKNGANIMLRDQSVFSSFNINYNFVNSLNIFSLDDNVDDNDHFSGVMDAVRKRMVPVVDGLSGDIVSFVQDDIIQKENFKWIYGCELRFMAIY